MPPPEKTVTLERIKARLRWLSSWTIHQADHPYESRNGVKAGEHQASRASITVFTSLDRDAVVGATSGFLLGEKSQIHRWPTSNKHVLESEILIS